MFYFLKYDILSKQCFRKFASGNFCVVYAYPFFWSNFKKNIQKWLA